MLARAAQPGQLKRVLQLIKFSNDEGKLGRSTKGVFRYWLEPALPIQCVKCIEILGVLVDAQFGFVKHVQGILRQASVRHGVMA